VVDVDLSIDPDPISDQASVSFRCDVDPNIEEPTNRDFTGFSDDKDRAYELVVDSKSYVFSQYGFFTFKAWVIQRKPEKTIAQFTVKETPHGVFGDVEVNLKFHLKINSVGHAGQILMWVHDIGSDNLLGVAAGAQSLQPITLSRSNPVALKIKNLLPSAAISVTQAEIFPSCEGFSAGGPILQDVTRVRFDRLQVLEGIRRFFLEKERHAPVSTGLRRAGIEAQCFSDV
jgi:hypothetical protein